MLAFPSTDTRPFSVEFSPLTRHHPLGGFVETDRKRDFYILTRIGKQFVSSFEIHRVGACICVRTSIRQSLATPPECLTLCTRVRRIATSLIEGISGRFPGAIYETLRVSIKRITCLIFKGDYIELAIIWGLYKIY